jgi:hypothetical protein
MNTRILPSFSPSPDISWKTGFTQKEKKVLVISAIAAAILLVIAPPIGIAFTATVSIGFGIYWVFKKHKINEQDNVATVPVDREPAAASLSSAPVIQPQVSFDDIIQEVVKSNKPDQLQSPPITNASLAGPWIAKEYAFDKAKIRINLEALFKMGEYKHLDERLLLGIRGDGDCTFRALYCGLLLKSSDLNQLYKKMLEIQSYVNTHSKNPKMLEQFNKSSSIMCEHMRALLQKCQKTNKPSAIPAGLQPTKPDRVKSSTIVESLANSAPELSKTPSNQALVSPMSEVDALSTPSHEAPAGIADKPFLEIFATIINPEFDRAFCQYLRALATNYTSIHQDSLPELSQTILTIESEGAQDYLEKKCSQSQPRDPKYFGNLVDADMVSNAFGQPLDWLKVEEKFTGPSAISTFAFNPPRVTSNRFYLLNRPGHTDLIL